jgi:hypothetical protein
MSDTPTRQTLDDFLVIVACRYKACAFKYLSLAVLSQSYFLVVAFTNDWHQRVWHECIFKIQMLLVTLTR